MTSRLAAICLAVTALGACEVNKAGTSARSSDASFAELYPYEEVNTLISLDYIEESRVGSHVHSFLLRNRSDEEIRFEADFGVAILAYDTNMNEWVEIENRVDYVSEPLMLLGEHSGPMSMAIISVSPDYPETLYPEIVRVVIQGQVANGTGSGDHFVYAYGDLPSQ